jgi:NAD(P)-dependent dehydrogenase (short-subunit alcohol dehydrogenase family)
MKLQGQHALVTGGGRGIGAAISCTLVKAGVKVTITGRSHELLEQHASSLHEFGEAQFQVCDVTDQSSISSAFGNAATALGPITILINNAGQAQSQPFLKTSLEVWQNMLEVNLTGTFLCTQAALPGMLEMGWGRIINVSSTAGLTGYPYISAYSAAKHGVIGLTRSLALELAKKNITVNAVCPGYTETEIVREAVQNIVAKTGRSELEARAELTKHNPQARLIHPNEIADTVMWLCNPDSSSITGQAIAIAGGEVMT